MNTGNDHTDEEEAIVCALEKQQLESIPLEAQDIATATNQDQAWDTAAWQTPSDKLYYQR